MEPESPVSLPNSPVPKLSKKEKKRKKAELIGELALAKTQCADVSNQLEHKSLELKHALQRESFVIRELRAAREYVTSLEQKVCTCMYVCICVCVCARFIFNDNYIQVHMCS